MKETTMTAPPVDAHASNLPTFIDILLDETGSMTSCRTETIAGFNSFVTDQQSVDGDCYMTLSKFDSASIRTPYVNLPIEMVPELTFFPGQMTNLYDVVGERITQVLEQNRTGRSLVVVITDGGENSSRKFDQKQVKELVERAIQGGVAFRYFGAGRGAMQTARDMGFPDHMVTEFDTRNMAETMTTVSSETRAFRAQTN